MKQVAHIASQLWRAERGWFVAGIAASAATILTGIALLGLAGWFIAATALAGLAGAGLSFNFFAPSAGIRFLALARTGSRYAERLVTHDASLRFLTVLRVDLFRGLATLKAPSLARWRGAEMLQRLTSDVDALDNLYLRLILPVAVLVLTAVALLLAILQIGWGVAGTIAALLVGGLATAVSAGAWTRKAARRLAAAQEALRVRSVDLVRTQTDLAVSGSLRAQKQSALKAARAMAGAARNSMPPTSSRARCSRCWARQLCSRCSCSQLANFRPAASTGRCWSSPCSSPWQRPRRWPRCAAARSSSAARRSRRGAWHRFWKNGHSTGCPRRGVPRRRQRDPR